MIVVRVERVHDAVDGWSDEWGPTFSPHAHLEALLQPTVLALVTVVLIHRTVAVATARVAQIPADAPLEETLAPYKVKTTTNDTTSLNHQSIDRTPKNTGVGSRFPIPDMERDRWDHKTSSLH